MKYCLEFLSNPDVVAINVDILVAKRPLDFFYPDHKLHRQPRVVRDLFATHGVSGVHVYPYQIDVEKGTVFEWVKLVSALITAIHENLDPDEPLIQTHPPRKIIFSGDGEYSYEEMVF